MKCTIIECPEEGDPFCSFHRNFISPKSWQYYQLCRLMNFREAPDILGSLQTEVVCSFSRKAKRLFKDFSLPRLESEFKRNPWNPEIQKAIWTEIKRRGLGSTPLKKKFKLPTEEQEKFIRTFQKHEKGPFFALLPKKSGKTTLASYLAVSKSFFFLFQGPFFFEKKVMDIGFLCEDEETVQKFLLGCRKIFRTLRFPPEEERNSLLLRTGSLHSHKTVQITAKKYSTERVSRYRFDTLILEDLGEQTDQKKIWTATAPLLALGGTYVILSPEPTPGTFWESLVNRNKSKVFLSGLPLEKKEGKGNAG